MYNICAIIGRINNVFTYFRCLVYYAAVILIVTHGHATLLLTGEECLSPAEKASGFTENRPTVFDLTVRYL